MNISDKHNALSSIIIWDEPYLSKGHLWERLSRYTLSFLEPGSSSVSKLCRLAGSRRLFWEAASKHEWRHPREAQCNPWWHGGCWYIKIRDSWRDRWRKWVFRLLSSLLKLVCVSWKVALQIQFPPSKEKASYKLQAFLFDFKQRALQILVRREMCISLKMWHLLPNHRLFNLFSNKAETISSMLNLSTC